jgi:NhaP-type Na+/H+ or K+/H+ antiporter
MMIVEKGGAIKTVAPGVSRYLSGQSDRRDDYRLMTANLWYLFAGGLLVVTALIASVVKRLPVTMAILYLVLGMVLGPLGLGLVSIDRVRHVDWLERLAEVALIVSVFTAGLKLRVPLRDPRWWVPVRLAWLSMVITVGLITAVGHWGLGLPVGVALLLGGILAPTDPVLAADVQLEHAYDRDRLRFSLTAEAGFNDGTAFSFVLLGLALIGGRESAAEFWPWFGWEVAWGTLAGLGVGACVGGLAARLFVYLRRTHHEAVGRDDFLALGLIALAYGLGQLIHAYGFLSVFAAGLALRSVEHRFTGPKPPPDVRTEEAATHPEKAAAHMTLAMVTWNEQVERILEVFMVLLVGVLLAWSDFRREEVWFVPVLLLLLRPVAVVLSLIGSRSGAAQRSLMAWFGIRGIGSLYYLFYAQRHGLPSEFVPVLSALTFTTVGCSILVHGISVTPLMKWYDRRGNKRGAHLRSSEVEVG